MLAMEGGRDGRSEISRDWNISALDLCCRPAIRICAGNDMPAKNYQFIKIPISYRSKQNHLIASYTGLIFLVTPRDDQQRSDTTDIKQSYR
jgi:hypothetical protein